MVGLGLLLGTVGVDLVSGEERFVFDVPHAARRLRHRRRRHGPVRDQRGAAAWRKARMRRAKQLSFRPEPVGSAAEREPRASASIWPGARGSVLGFFLGLLPGGGAMLASFASYMMERKLSRQPELFGKGAVAGVAGPEAANNAGAQASFVPLLCLGIPANAVIGVIMGALLMAGVTPGPKLIADHPEPVLGRDRQHVRRQPDAGGAEHPAGRPVRVAAAGAGQHHVGADRRLLRDRRLQSEQRDVRCVAR